MMWYDHKWTFIFMFNLYYSIYWPKPRPNSVVGNKSSTFNQSDMIRKPRTYLDSRHSAVHGHAAPKTRCLWEFPFAQAQHKSYHVIPWMLKPAILGLDVYRHILMYKYWCLHHVHSCSKKLLPKSLFKFAKIHQNNDNNKNLSSKTTKSSWWAWLWWPW